jgi:hypothetical protein
MRALVGILFQLFFLSVSSASVFLFSNIVLPIKAAQEIAPLQMPRLNLNFDEFSAAYAAMEDDYYLSRYEEETIPVLVPSEELKPARHEIIQASAPQLQLPQMTMSTEEENVANAQLITKQIVEPLKIEKESSAAALLQNQISQGTTKLIPLPHFWLQGKIELSEGLAISDPRDNLFVGWFVNGERKKEGKISLRDGTYEIKVDRLEGELIAELSDKKGFLMGEAIIDLDVIRRQKALTGFVVSGLDLKLKPYNFSLKGQVQSVYDNDKTPQGLANVDVQFGDHDFRFRTNSSGKFEEPLVSPHSSGLLLAQQDRYRQTVALANFDRNIKIRMFPDQFVDSLFDTIQLPKKLRNDGVVLGRILKNDKPVLGYQARIAKHSAKPIYFQMYIANQSITKTSEDGQFVFVGMGDGEYEIEIVDTIGQLVDSKLVAVRLGSVSDVTFEIGQEKNLGIRPFDPLSMTPKGVEFFAQGQAGTLEVQTEEILNISTYQGQEPLMVYTKVEGANQEAISLLSRNKKFQEVPVLNSQWWAGIQKTYKIELKVGVIVGFIDSDESFEAYIDHQNDNTKILYFDQHGRTIEKSSGVKPSGFIIYGVEPGVHTVILESEQGQIHSEAAYVDGESIALMYKSF